MGHGNQHHAGLHIRNINQIGANFGRVDVDYRFYCASAPEPKINLESGARSPSKPIQRTLFLDVMNRDNRQVIVFNLHVDTMEYGKCYPEHNQLILLIHKSEKLDPTILTKEQYRWYQTGLANGRLLTFSMQQPEAVRMLEQHLTKKKFGYQDKSGQHLITVCSWK